MKSLMVVIILFSSLSLFGQTEDSLNTNNRISNDLSYNNKLESDSLSTYYKNLCIGIPELFSLGFGYNLDKMNSFGIKFNLAIVDAGYILPIFGITLGFRYSYTFYFINDIFMTTHITISPILSKQTFISGSQIELSIGYNGNKEKGFLFIYEFGIIYSNFKDRNGTLYPSVQIGFQHNF